MDGIVVAVDASILTVIEGIFELTQDVHPNDQVRSSLLDGFLLERKKRDEPTHNFLSLDTLSFCFHTLTNTKVNEVSTSIGKVGVSSCERCGGPGETGRNPLISVIGDTVVIVKLFEIGVGTSNGAAQHFGIGTSAETLNGTAVVVGHKSHVVVYHRDG